MEPNIFLSFDTITYNLRENEILILEKLLTKEYFENLIASGSNYNVTYNTFDNVEPSISIRYSNTYDYDEERKDNDISCNITINKISNYWKQKLNNNYDKITYDSTSNKCSYKMISDIVYDMTNERPKINEMRDKLIKAYKNYDVNEIMYIWKNQGKNEISNLLVLNNMNVSKIVNNNNYYLTNIDLILLSKIYDIPLILMSSTLLYDNKEILMKVNSLDDDKYYMIRVPGIYNDKVPEYSVLGIEENIEVIDINNINEIMKNYLMKLEDLNVDEFISNYKNNNIINNKLTNIQLFKRKNRFNIRKRLKVLDTNIYKKEKLRCKKGFKQSKEGKTCKRKLKIVKTFNKTAKNKET